VPLTRCARTQNPCNDPFHRNLCCAPHDGETVCANWTGAHAISAGASTHCCTHTRAALAPRSRRTRAKGCILYGTLTAEMGLKMPHGAQGTHTRAQRPRLLAHAPTSHARIPLTGTLPYIPQRCGTLGRT
jgi:hypothetical protein